MSAYRFPTSRRKKSDTLDVPSFFGGVMDTEPEEQPGIINGQQARSLLEWRVAKALWKLGLDFYYQYPLFGGTQVRGGFVIDFLVFVAPGNIPLEVQGARWHTNSFASDELMREAVIEQTLGVEMRYVWENQLQNDQDTHTAVKKAIYG